MKYYLTGHAPQEHFKAIIEYVRDSVAKRFGGNPLFLVDPDSYVHRQLIDTRYSSKVPLRWLTIDPLHPPAIAEAIVIDDASGNIDKCYRRVKHLNCLWHSYKVRPANGSIIALCQECFQIDQAKFITGTMCQYCQNCHCVYVDRK